MVEDRQWPARDLVGREHELSRLSMFLEGAASIGAQLMVTAQPGMGKSSLLRAAASIAVGGGSRVLYASGVEFEADVGFAALHQLLSPERASFATLEPRYGEALYVCLGMVQGPPPLRSTVTTAALALVRKLSVDRPVLLVVDDVQWLDRSSAAVLTSLVGNLAGMRAGFLGARRLGEDSFFDRGNMPELEIPPLTRDAAESLLARRDAHLAGPLRSRLLDHAQGNPLALLQLPIDFAGDTSRRRSEPDLPDRLQRLFASRITALSAGTRHFLLLAALDTSSELRVVWEAGRGRVSDADVDSAVGRGLVAVDARAGTVRFAHPLIRSTVVGLAGAGERRDAHWALGQAEDTNVVRRAQHLAAAQIGPDDSTAALLEESAHVLLRRGDPVGAVATLLRSAELSGRPQHRARRLAHAAYVGADVTGDLDRVSALLADARSGVTQQDGSLVVAVAAAYLLLNGDGDVETAHRLVVGALRSPVGDDEVPEPRLAEALLTLLGICFFGGRTELWEPFVVELKRLEPAVPRALHLCAHTFAAPAREGALVLDELRAVIAGLHEEPDLQEIVLIGRAAFYVDQVDDCRPALWRVVTEGAQRGAITPMINAWMLLAFNSFLGGHWDDARRYAQEGLALCEERGFQLLAWPGRYCLALVAAARGDDEFGATTSDEMLRWAQPRGVRSVMAYAHHVAAVAALGRNDFETAYRHASAVSAAGVIDPALAHALWLTMDLVDAAVHSNRHREAAAHVAAMRAIDIGALSSRYALMLAACEAMVEPDDATDLYERALRIEDAERWPFELARIHLAYGERLRRLGRHIQARDQLRCALDAFELLGATPWVLRVRSQLQASNSRRHAHNDGGSPLTAREQEVARLAASGLTNTQIATVMGVSGRTVSAHLSHVLAKLAISSRAGLRDALARDDDGASPPGPDT